MNIYIVPVGYFLHNNSDNTLIIYIFLIKTVVYRVSCNVGENTQQADVLVKL